jgi:hypothetical protein
MILFQRLYSTLPLPCPPLKMNFIFKMPDDILENVVLTKIVLTKFP